MTTDPIIEHAVKVGMDAWDWRKNGRRSSVEDAITVAVEDAVAAMRAEARAMSEDRSAKVNARIAELEADNERLADLLKEAHLHLAVIPVPSQYAVSGIVKAIDAVLAEREAKP